jgi:hypothetical protein
MRWWILESVTQSRYGRFKAPWGPRYVGVSLLHEEIAFPALTDEAVERLQECEPKLLAGAKHEDLSALLLGDVSICYDEPLYPS